MDSDQVTTSLLAYMLEGSTHANALRRNGKPAPVWLPDSVEERTSLVKLHLQGKSRVLKFCPAGQRPWSCRVPAVVLAAFCPDVHSRCRWIAIDLDAADHGTKGLADAPHAARAIATAAAAAGLDSGLLVARSRRGKGRHVFILLRRPTNLADAVMGVAAIAAAAFNMAQKDTRDDGAPHAFRCVDGTIAKPGQSGAFELIPHSSLKPPYGWAITLPAAGKFASQDGGVLVDPFTDTSTTLRTVPACDSAAWENLVAETRRQHADMLQRFRRIKRNSVALRLRAQESSLDRIIPRTRDFLNGWIQEGDRNNAAFAASANLLRCGVDSVTASRLILQGAIACGLPEREALAAFQSATRACNRR